MIGRQNLSLLNRNNNSPVEKNSSSSSKTRGLLNTPAIVQPTASQWSSYRKQGISTTQVNLPEDIDIQLDWNTNQTVVSNATTVVPSLVVPKLDFEKLSEPLDGISPDSTYALDVEKNASTEQKEEALAAFNRRLKVQQALSGNNSKSGTSVF